MLQGIWNGRDTACKVKQEHKYKDQIEMSVENKVSLELCLKNNLSDWILNKADSLFKKINLFKYLNMGSKYLIC